MGTRERAKKRELERQGHDTGNTHQTSTQRAIRWEISNRGWGVHTHACTVSHPVSHVRRVRIPSRGEKKNRRNIWSTESKAAKITVKRLFLSSINLSLFSLPWYESHEKSGSKRKRERAGEKDWDRSDPFISCNSWHQLAQEAHYPLRERREGEK